MKGRIVFLIILVLGIQSCKLGTTKHNMNESISSPVLEEINALDAKAMQALVDKDVEALKALMSDELWEVAGNEMPNFLSQVNQVVKTKKYQILDQFHVQNSTVGMSNSVMTGFSNLDDYTVEYKALNSEMFVSLILPEIGDDKYLVTNIYGKYPEGWKLNIIQFGRYSFLGKTAPQLYAQAKEELEKGYMVDAINSMYLSSNVYAPANQHLKYQHQEEMEAFHAKIMKEGKSKYAFPIVFTEIETKPQVVNIALQGAVEGFFPIVNYLTTIDLQDTVQTKIENDAMHAIIGDKFYGINKNKKYVFYKAFSEMPKGKKEVPVFVFAQENEL